MISERQLEEWRQQSLKDAEAYRQDEQQLKELHADDKSQLSTFFERLRGRYFNFYSEEDDKLSRLLAYTEMEKEIEHYPGVLRTYLTYNTCSLIIFAGCILAPKKIVSKVILSLVAYGFKRNITDGMFTYYMVETMALSPRMTDKEQELRNVVEFYYMHKFFRKAPMNDEQKRQAARLLADIQRLNATYTKFKQVQQLL